MKYPRIQIVAFAIVTAASAIAPAGLIELCSRGCSDNCCAEQACCATKCVPEYKSVKVKKHCWQTECEEVCIPPVTLPCCKCLFKGAFCRRGKCQGCADGCSSGDCCGSGCRNNECCRNSLLQRMFSCCAGCRTRCVNRLKKHEYECEETAVEWKCVRTGCCDQGACCEPDCCAP